MITNRINLIPVALLGATALIGVYACGSGDTDGGAAEGYIDIVDGPVSDGGFGSTLEITLNGGGNEIGVGDTEGFLVDALDPQGLPLAYQRVYCVTERGLVLVEPTTRYESTNAGGRMSGVLGCEVEGSFLLECRLEEGFNLRTRKHIRCSGSGTAVYPGAVGGSLGGGVAGDSIAPFTLDAAATADEGGDGAMLGQSN